MRTRTQVGLGIVLLVGGSLALSSLAGRAADDGKGGFKLLVAESTNSALINDEIKIVNDALKGEKVPPKDLKRAKVGAMMLAIYAESTKNANLYSQAMKVIEALRKEDGLKEAQMEAAKLSKPDAGKLGGDPLKAVWDDDNKDYDKDMAMQFFKGTRAGGLGYEKMIKDLSEKKALTAKEMTDVATMANKAAMLSQAIERIGPTKATGSKTPANWKKFAVDLQVSSLDTAKAAAKKDSAGTKAALGRMDKACVNCHEVFKAN